MQNWLKSTWCSTFDILNNQKCDMQHCLFRKYGHYKSTHIALMIGKSMLRHYTDFDTKGNILTYVQGLGRLSKYNVIKSMCLHWN